MTLALIVNGASIADLSHALAVNDRGLQYGDGLFETALLANGEVRFLDAHVNRLYEGCERLQISQPERTTLLAEIARATANLRSAVVKIIVTRGVSARGYQPAPQAAPTRIVAVYPAPEATDTEIIADWRSTPLGRNPLLAGLKHLNRLEQVMASAERTDPSIREGLMLDTEGELVCGISSNVFLVRDGVLMTPDLRFCGVRGVMRAQVLKAAAELRIPVTVEPLWPHDLDAAGEVFVTNAVRGIRSIAQLGERRFGAGPIARSLRAALAL